MKDEKGATRQRLYSDKFLSENYPQFSDVNDLPEIKGFLEHYYDIGNIIPTWPGANVNRGMAHCYDIPNVYYKRHAKFTKLVYGSIYRNVFIEKILENDKYGHLTVLSLFPFSQCCYLQSSLLHKSCHPL